MRIVLLVLLFVLFASTVPMPAKKGRSRPDGGKARRFEKERKRAARAAAAVALQREAERQVLTQLLFREDAVALRHVSGREEVDECCGSDFEAMSASDDGLQLDHDDALDIAKQIRISFPGKLMLCSRGACCALDVYAFRGCALHKWSGCCRRAATGLSFRRRHM
jgi:hypothetical protein